MQMFHLNDPDVAVFTHALRVSRAEHEPKPKPTSPVPSQRRLPGHPAPHNYDHDHDHNRDGHDDASDPHLLNDITSLHPRPYHEHRSTSSSSSGGSSAYSSSSSSNEGLATPPTSPSLHPTSSSSDRPSRSPISDHVVARTCSNHCLDEENPLEPKKQQQQQQDSRRTALKKSPKTLDSMHSHPLFAPWSSFTKIFPTSAIPTEVETDAKQRLAPTARVQPQSLPNHQHSSATPLSLLPTPTRTSAAPLKCSKPLPPPTISSPTSSSISAPPRPPAFSREAEEVRRGRNRWPRLLWNSELDAHSLDVLRAYHERAVGGPLPVLRLGDSKHEIAQWSRRMEMAGL